MHVRVFMWSVFYNAPVAQLDRASAYGAEGWGFESLQAHQSEIPPNGGILNSAMDLVSVASGDLTKSSRIGSWGFRTLSESRCFVSGRVEGGSLQAHEKTLLILGKPRFCAVKQTEGIVGVAPPHIWRTVHLQLGTGIRNLPHFTSVVGSFSF